VLGGLFSLPKFPDSQAISENAGGLPTFGRAATLGRKEPCETTFAAEVARRMPSGKASAFSALWASWGRIETNLLVALDHVALRRA
jgi:hypothetical protein